MAPLLLDASVGEKIDAVFYQFDMFIYHIFSFIHCGFMNKVAMAFTSFGDERFVIPVAIIALCLCFFKKTRKYGATIAGAIVLGTLLTNIVLKPAVLRIRPYNTLQGIKEYWDCYIGAGAFSESDYSFPSGHTTGVFEIAVSLGLCLRKDGKKGISWIPSIIAFLTGLSRIYLCVHYPSDIIGGILAGTIAAVISYVIVSVILNAVKNTFIDKIDLSEKVSFFKKNGKAIIAVCVVASFMFSFITQFSEGGNAERCAYEGSDYNCYNEAKTGDDYPPIDGKNYCKIHRKQLLSAE
ncbi:MAG: phosphatase PAP2 family protein [Clostridiales bacterium]|nr:phosphatase PAP2 family protein [Clostridiales bacterium]